MKFFCTAFYTIRYRTVEGTLFKETDFACGHLDATNEDEAMGIALRMAIKGRPKSDGWEQHQVRVGEINRELVAEIAKIQAGDVKEPPTTIPSAVDVISSVLAAESEWDRSSPSGSRLISRWSTACAFLAALGLSGKAPCFPDTGME